MPTILIYSVEYLKHFVLAVQEFVLLIGHALINVFRRPGDWRDYTDQMDNIGPASVPTVILTGFFVGAILVTQAGPELKEYGAESLLGRFTGISVVRGIGPVITAMMVASRVCSGTAAEIGMMQVNQQIEALESIGTDPIAKLITPRIVSAILMFPLLTILNIAAAIVSGGLLAGQGNLRRFVMRSLSGLQPHDMGLGLTKAMIFGFSVVSLACYYGFRAEGGANGVRAMTTRAVVTSLMLILALDFGITTIIHAF